MTSTRQPPDTVATVVAGFIVWLARQRHEPDYRHRCPVTAERFLNWQERRGDQRLPATLDAYCIELRADGVTENQLDDIRSIIGELVEYLQSSS